MRGLTPFVFAVIVFAGFFLRFYGLADRPLHHDEGALWGMFTGKIFKGEALTYYNGFSGFTSWYLGVIPFYFMGVNVFSLRFMAALCGSCTVLLLYPLRKHLGDAGLLVCGLLLAVSPSMVYYSRQVSQYPYFVFFLMLSFVCITLYLGEFGNRFLYLFSVSFALLATTHDLVVLLIAVAASFVLLLWLFDFSGVFVSRVECVFSRVGKKAFLVSVLLVLFVGTSVMSSFYRDFSPLYDIVSAVRFQLDKTGNTGHNKGFSYYFKTFAPIELPVFLGSLAGVFFMRRGFFSAFVAYWVVASFLLFSAMPYKIPWMFTIVLLPMFILAGLGADSVFARLRGVKWLERAFAVIMLVFVAYSASMSINLNYLNPVSRDNILNYVGPTEDLRRLVGDIDDFLDGGGGRVLITAESHQPLDFYLRNRDVTYLTSKGKLDVAKYPEYDLIIVDGGQADNKTYEGFDVREYELRIDYVLRVYYRIGA